MYWCLHQIFDELCEALGLNQALQEWPDVAYVLATLVGGRVIQERRKDLLLLSWPLRQLCASGMLA